MRVHLSMFPAMLLVTSACGHSPPVGIEDQHTRGPLSDLTPIRLTYSQLSDDQPTFSEGGDEVVYRFRRDTPDGDHCLGVLPAGGGTRTRALCAPSLDEAGFADDIGIPALRIDALAAFTMHRGRIGGIGTPDASGLWVARIDSGEEWHRVTALHATPPGASGRWDDLLATTWLPDGELLVVAATRMLVPDCKYTKSTCPHDVARYAGFDTLRLGFELAKVDVEAGTIVRLAETPEAVAASFDHATGRVVYLAQRASIADAWHEPTTDTIYVVPMSGGVAVPLAGWPRPDRPSSEHLHGVAAGAGRLLVSRSWRSGSWVADTYSIDLYSDIAEVMPDGSLLPRFEKLGWRWGRLAMSPDGRWLLAESVNLVSPTIPRPTTETDLYLFDLGG